MRSLSQLLNSAFVAKLSVDNMHAVGVSVFQQNFIYTNRQQVGLAPWLQFANPDLNQRSMTSSSFLYFS